MGFMPVLTYESASDPTVSDDGSLSYRQGVFWRNTSSGEVFFCADAAIGAASWLPLGTVLDATEIGYLDSVTAGTSAASKALVLDANSELNSVGVLKTADVLIAGGASVQGLNTTPVSLVAAPGAGITLEFVASYIFLDWAASAAYDFAAGEDLVVRYTNGSGAIVSNSVDSTVINASADTQVRLSPVSADSGSPSALAMVENAALVLHALVGDATAGDSPLKIRTLYREIRTASMEAIA